MTMDKATDARRRLVKRLTQVIGEIPMMNSRDQGNAALDAILADLDALAAVVDPAEMVPAFNRLGGDWRIVRNDPDHYVCFTEDTWFIEHALDCRIAGTIGTCEYNHAILDIAEDLPDPEQLGRWRITGIDSEGLPSLERAEVRRQEEADDA